MQKHERRLRRCATPLLRGPEPVSAPILMTSFAFIAGLIPLVLATGAGANGNRTIGTAALGGMLFGTVFGVIIIPGLYYIFGTLAAGRKLIDDENEYPISEGVEPRVLVERNGAICLSDAFTKA
ncbi:MAG: efflux RND transporter permease subunit [Hymenobacter sp.]